MKIEITKEQIEKTLGYEIKDFSLHPHYKDGLCNGLEICITPTVSEIKIPMEVTITTSR
jgi:hypothetical protein